MGYVTLMSVSECEGVCVNVTYILDSRVDVTLPGVHILQNSQSSRFHHHQGCIKVPKCVKDSENIWLVY